MKKKIMKSILGVFFVVFKLFRIATSEKSYLKNKGYFKSFKLRIPVDAKNQPVPWMNYPFVDFISNRLNKSLEVFEYGSGFSTLYFQNIVKSIKSVENKKDWFDEISKKAGKNVEIIYHGPEQKEAYAKSININSSNQRYDLIIVDDIDRLGCVKQAVNYLKTTGVILLDDSHRTSYLPIFNFMKEAGFKEITIGGLKPGSLDLNKSTIFYRPDNILNI